MGYWEIAGSSEQNGMFELKCMKEKVKLIMYKRKHILPNATNIIPLTTKLECHFAIPGLVRNVVTDRQMLKPAELCALQTIALLQYQLNKGHGDKLHIYWYTGGDSFQFVNISIVKKRWY